MSDLVQTYADAVGAAREAALTAGVEVRELAGIQEEAALIRLLSEIWGRTSANPPVPPELLRAFAKAGNYISGAFDGDRLVGAAIAFHSTPERHALHSHIAGVGSSHVGRSIGFAMKLHQRSWALERGIDAIEWTFDPLVARNAHFNVAKLHALPIEYLPDFYGAMRDAINGEDETDRILVRWELRDDGVIAAASGAPWAVDATAPGCVVVPVPPDVETLRVTDPARAREWRRAVRDDLMRLLGGGGRIVGFDRLAGYIVREGDTA